MSPAFEADTYPSIVLRMLAMIRHRGPDEQGYYVDADVALAAARLSVIDPAGGTQPLSDDSGRYWIVYNGEIYNYKELGDELAGMGERFSTRSDTEIVLKAWMRWREHAFARLNGGFAFAIYDRSAGTLTLARDRWGKRPLYYTRHRGAFMFASEMKAFLEYPHFEFRWSSEQLSSAFALWTLLPDETGFEDIHQLPPGTYLVAGASGSRLETYATLDPAPTPFAGGVEQAVALTRARLSESVRLRLRSDVEVGTYLSGGLDSSVVTLLAAEHSRQPVRTFSIGFEEHDFDESIDQGEVSRHLGTRHTHLVTNSREIGRWFPEAVWHAETPVFRTAFVPMFLLSRLVRDHGVKVVLTGEGADEVFLGYEIFKETLLRRQWNVLDLSDRLEGLSQLYPYQRHFRPEAYRSLAAVFGEHSRDVDDEFFSHRLRFANATLATRLLRSPADGVARLRAWSTRERDTFDRLGPLARAQWIEFRTLLPGYLLSTQGDRMAFAHGVENRCPFLDPSVVTWANSLPVEMRLPDLRQEKFILKEAFRGALPPRIIDKPKRPYVAPDMAPFLGSTRPEYVEDALSERAFADLGLVDETLSRRLVRKVLSSAPADVSPRESQAFILLLSLVLLHRSFVSRSYDRPPLPDIAGRASDRRNRGA